jgi:hypothetical protein
VRDFVPGLKTVLIYGHLDVQRRVVRPAFVLKEKKDGRKYLWAGE